MIEGVARIVTTVASRLPVRFEVPITAGGRIETLWMTSEDHGHFFRLTEVESGESIDVHWSEPVTWLQHEDMNSPAIQAEIITALAAKGIEL